ncbi:MAG TPA: zinc ribbon domain-containing protein [Solirubrobacteraceae bacterium]|nr:zinc ribbon domain-containing protein [Solirubrobacteraceae bacterium]
MPIYEYRRPDGSTFEVVQSFADDPLEKDPDTGAPVERVLHAPAVHFKGKGFYNTDYGTRKRQRETAASADGSSSGDSSAADSSGSDGSGSSSNGDSAAKTDTKQGESSSKPATKSDAKPVAAAK